LREVLDLAGYNGESWEDLVQQIALTFRPGCDHLLRPGALSNWPAVLWEQEELARAALCRWRELAGLCAPGKFEEHRWSIGFRKLVHAANIRRARHDKLLLALLE